MTNTAERIEIHASPWKHIVLVVLGIGMTATSAAVAVPLLPNVPPGSFGQFIGYIGTVFFGVCTVLIVWRAFSQHGPVVTIAPEGLRDIRIAAEFIPWNAIRSISVWSMNGQKSIILSVDPSVEEGLTLTRVVRWTRKANAALGADGLAMTAQGLKLGHSDLLDTILRYHDAHSDNLYVMSAAQ